MNTSFSLLNSPITVDIGEWVCNNIGMIAAGKRISDSKVELMAIEKAEFASDQMTKFAKDNHAMILSGISEGEVNAID